MKNLILTLTFSEFFLMFQRQTFMNISIKFKIFERKDSSGMSISRKRFKYTLINEQIMIISTPHHQQVENVGTSFL